MAIGLVVRRVFVAFELHSARLHQENRRLRRDNALKGELVALREAPALEMHAGMAPGIFQALAAR